MKLRMEVLMLVLLLFHQSFSFCWSLNTEGELCYVLSSYGWEILFCMPYNLVKSWCSFI